MCDAYTPRQAAALLGMSAASVYRMIRLNRLAARAVGRTYAITPDAIDRYLLANSERPAVQRAMFARLDQVAQRNSDVHGDVLLDQLEQDDKHARRLAAG